MSSTVATADKKFPATNMSLPSRADSELTGLTPGPWARSEDRGADPDHCRPLLHRDLDIVAHPHRVLDGAHDAAQAPQFTKIRPRLIGIRDCWWNNHQPVESKVAAALQLVPQRLQVLRQRPAFLRLAPHVDLDEHGLNNPQPGRSILDVLSQSEAIDRLNPRETPDRLPHFVALQPSDQVP